MLETNVTRELNPYQLLHHFISEVLSTKVIDISVYLYNISNNISHVQWVYKVQF